MTQSLGGGDEAHVILQAIGAGLVQDDRFASSIVVQGGAAAHVVAQGSTVAHAMPVGDASQPVRLEVLPGGALTFLPKPLVLFPDAKVTNTLDIMLHNGGHVFWCDAFLCHDAGRKGRRFRRFGSSTILRLAGQTRALDRFVIDGAAVDDRGTMQGYPIHAGFGWGSDGFDDASLESRRAAVTGCSGVMAGLSLLPDNCGVFGRLWPWTEPRCRRLSMP